QTAYNYLINKELFIKQVVDLDEIVKAEMAAFDEKIKGFLSEQRKIKNDETLSDTKRNKALLKLDTSIKKAQADKKKIEKNKTKSVKELFASTTGVPGETEISKLMRTIEIDENIKAIDTVDKKSFLYRAAYIANKDFSMDMKKGIIYGRCNTRMYKQNGQLCLDPVHTGTIRFTKDGVNKFHWSFCGFKLRFDIGRRPSQNIEIRSTLEKIVSGEIIVPMSKIDMVPKPGKRRPEYYLSMPLSEKKREVILDDNRVMGVDLGIDIPAYAAFNFAPEWGKQFGDKKYLLDFKTSIREQRRRAQKNMIFAKGGKGRSKKLKSNKLEALRNRESNFSKTFNHVISKRIVDHAVSNRCGIIKLEDLSSVRDKKDTKLLANWTYYQLQSFIEMKAERYGVKVQYVNPYNTSKKCWKCGNIKENFAPGNRDGKDGRQYHCEKCGLKINSDHNAAINIAMS
ncbi:TPA: RNA-guided endonuclease TnpB family protein, partial [Streptococcus suis]